jgi:multidrug efflux system membrane fusion protein
MAGCVPHATKVAPATAPTVDVSLPVSREVTDYVDFTGRTQAKDAVNIEARATGYLIKISFKEGAEVNAGDLLFEIDPKPYQAQYNQALGQVNLYKAQLKLAQVTLDRDEKLAKINPGAIAALQLDTDKAAVDEADAQVKAAEASLDLVNQNLGYTKVYSPISGQVSRYYLTLGNLISQDQTVLTTVVSLDPMYAYVDVDEPTVLRVRKAINAGQIKPYGSGQIPILMGLQGEDGFPHEGKVDFVNNQINPTTGTILARGVFENLLPPGGRRLLLPGMFVRIRLPIGQPHPAVLVIDRAIQQDQSLKYVYVMDPESKKVQRRNVTTGPLESDGLRQITAGLKPNELVVVGSLQQLHPDMEIQPEQIPMATLSGRTTEGGQAEAGGKAAPKVSGTASTALSVLGGDDAGEAGLSYTWSATTVPDGATAPSFSVNGNNAAKNTLATLNKAGTYGFTVTIADSGGLSVSSSFSVPVEQTLTSIAVSPATANVNPEAAQQFTATGLDQFGSPLAAQPKFAWTTTVGTITEEGLFTAQKTRGSGKVTAGAPGTAGRGKVEGSSSVTVTGRPPTVVVPPKATIKAP